MMLITRLFGCLLLPLCALFLLSGCETVSAASGVAKAGPGNPDDPVDPPCITCTSDDVDGDGVTDFTDNCVFKANPSQQDFDNDGFGTACDADYNNDCTVNFQDVSIFVSNWERTGPGMAQFDHNGDSVVTMDDYEIVKSLFLKKPGPGQSTLCD